MTTNRALIERLIDRLNKQVGQELYFIGAYSNGCCALSRELDGGSIENVYSGSTKEVRSYILGMLAGLSSYESKV